MYKILRIICCVISALFVAACIFLFIFLDPIWGIGSVIAAVAFFALTMLFKSLQEEHDEKHSSADTHTVEHTDENTEELKNNEKE